MSAVPALAGAGERERLLRRIEELRARHAGEGTAEASVPALGALIDLRRRRSERFADALAAAVGGEVVPTVHGRVVRIPRAPVSVAVDREALAALPGQPPRDAPLVCLDTETTGLGTGAGTVAFLVGLGWWADDAFHQVQLLLPDHADEPALLAAVRASIPPDGWLVTYNGRGFDWPLLVTRFRLGRAAPPDLAGHLDLLPVVRALFRHRLSDARLRTVEAELLHLGRIGDVDGWEIPGRYLGYLRDGDAGGLVEVVRHNHEDVRTLARLLGHLSAGLARADRRIAAHPGDLGALGRLFARAGQVEEALACLDAAAANLAAGVAGAVTARLERAPEPWWSPRVSADIGGPPRRPEPDGSARRFDGAWTAERIDRERARLLRRAGRIDDAIAAWRSVALRGGRIGVLAWVEVAKLQEHRRRDPAAALAAVDRAERAGARLRASGLGVRGLDAELARRRMRLTARLERASRTAVPA